MVKAIVFVCSSQTTFNPNCSPTKRNGTNTLSATILAGISRDISSPFFCAILPSTAMDMTLSSFFMVTTSLEADQSTSAPIFSAIALTGTIAISFSKKGGASKEMGLPS